MSYRTFKRLLGETSLERKCRLLFGGGLLILISGSFYLYSMQTRNILTNQNKEVARNLVTTAIVAKHAEYFERIIDERQNFPATLKDIVTKDMTTEEKQNFSAILKDLKPEEKRSFSAMLNDLKPESQKQQSWALLKLKPTTEVFDGMKERDKLSPDEASKKNKLEADLSDAASRPKDTTDYKAIEYFSASNTSAEREWVPPMRDEYRYYAKVKASESCLACHREHNHAPNLKEGDVLGIVKITHPMTTINKDLEWNNAILLATAIITTALAWLATYAIVRYVIVKPVLHLKEVSDSITRGDLDKRADIRTGDEFEELSQAFNRMLRHLTDVQEDLQKLNRGFAKNVDELAQANLRLFELNKLKNEFLATMSHELRTPLNSILGFSDVLLTNPANLTEKQQRYVAHIKSSGRTLLNLITDVLDLAKIESGKMELHPVEMSIGDLVERVVGSMTPLAEKKNLDLSWDIDSDVPLIFQDSGKLQQILNNLLSNAIKFTPEGGRVRVRALQRDNHLVLVVEDTGIGIPLEDQERIFEKFRQGSTTSDKHNPLTREFEGTGLGLSITRELSKLLGGSIGLQSEFGKGSRFTVTVPIRLEIPAEADPTKPRPVSEAIDLMLERPSGLNRIRSPKAEEDSGRSQAGDSASAPRDAD